MTGPTPTDELVVVRAGARLDHDPDYRVDRPHGSGDWLFVHFITAIALLDGDTEHTLQPGACILFSPGKPQRYRPLPGRRYLNNWCHFTGTRATDLVSRCGLPTDTPILPLSGQPIGALIAALSRECTQRPPLWHESAAALLTQLLVAFARAEQEPRQPRTDPARRALAARMHELRATVHRRLTHAWTVAEMAAAVNLSPSRFAHCYHELFHCGPLQDLIDARIAHAGNLLARGTVLVKEVAAACGFSDQHHFSKSFRARMGCTPSAYARDQRSDLP